MEAIEAILKINVSDIFNIFDEAGVINKLEALQEHENTDIYNKVSYLLETYLNGEEDEVVNNENTFIPTNNGNVFSFGMNNTNSGKNISTSNIGFPSFNTGIQMQNGFGF